MQLHKVTFFIVIAAVLLETLSEAFPKFIPVNIFTFLVPPALLIHYYVSTQKENYLYVLALLFVFLGIIFYNISIGKQDVIGVVFYVISVIIYIGVVLKLGIDFSTKSIFKIAVPFIIFFIIPTFFLLQEVNDSTFYVSVLYAFAIGVFLCFGVLDVLDSKQPFSIYLLLSGVFITIATMLSGYVTFVNNLFFLQVLEVPIYSLSHFFMCLYVIDRTNNNNVINETI